MMMAGISCLPYMSAGGLKRSLTAFVPLLVVSLGILQMIENK